MPNYYIGGATNPIGAMFQTAPAGNSPKPPIRPATENIAPVASTAALPGNVLPAQAVRAVGPTKGYDPAYLQNLATAIGGLFSNRSGKPMNINPLGNLSEISPSSGMEGNAPLPSLPSTWLQDALNGLGFSFTPKSSATPTRPVTSGGTDNGGGRGGGRGRNLWQ
jgi:hypothetical protein